MTYLVDVLPGWLRTVAFFVPASHVFEALRAFVDRGEVLAGRLAFAGLLDVAYLAAGAAVSRAAYRAVRVKGLLSRPGY